MSKNVRRLFAGFVPKQYDLKLEPNPETLVITGSVTVTGQKVGRPSQRLTFHQNGLKIASARITRRDKKGEQSLEVTRIVHHKNLNEVRLHTEQLLYPGAYTVEMTFTGSISAGMQGVYYSDYKVDGEQKRLVSTQFESHFARQAFPCVDEPEAKAMFALQLTTPADLVVLSNMPAKKQTTTDAGEKCVTAFQVTPPMSPYLLAFVFGDMQYKEAVSKSGVPVRVWATKAHTPESLDFALDVSVRGIDFFEEYFDTPFPMPKCDNVAIPDFSAAGMENWGLLTYREFAVLANPDTVSQANREIVAEVVLHEISHQWFGDLVTMKWWDDLWLNESFANVMGFVAIDALFPKWHIWDSYIATDGLAAFRRDSIAGVQAIKTNIRHPSEIGSIFDPSIVYAKGGRLIYMLIQYLGQDVFCKGLQAYFAKHAHGNTTGKDLWEALSSASGQNVAAIMEPWLARSGFPAIELTQTNQSLTLEQSHFLVNPAKTDPTRLWPVPVLADSPKLPELLDEQSVSLELPSDKFVRVNTGAVGHYAVHYVNPEHAEYVASLAAAKTLTAAERLILLNDSSMLARAGRQSFSATLQLLEHYTQEDEEPVWSILALVLADLRRFIDIDETLETAIKAKIRTLISAQYQRLGWTEQPKESTQDTKLRALILSLGVYAEHAEITKQALEKFGEYKKNVASVPAELRSVVFGAAIRKNVHGAFDYLIELEEETANTDLKQDAMDALTLVRDETHIRNLLHRLQNSAKVRQHDVDRWIAYLVRNRHARPLTWQWLQDNWAWIKQTFADDHSYDYFPRYTAGAFNTPQLLAEYKTFFEPLMSELALERNIILGIEEIETRVAWLQRDIAAVKVYLA